MQNDKEQMIFANTFDVSTGSKLSHKLEEQGVRFQLEGDCSVITNLSLVEVRRGGTFGLGAEVSFYVHTDDLDKFENVCQNLIAPHVEQEIPEEVESNEKGWFRRFFGL